MKRREPDVTRARARCWRTPGSPSLICSMVGLVAADGGIWGGDWGDWRERRIGYGRLLGANGNPSFNFDDWLPLVLVESCAAMEMGEWRRGKGS